MYIFHLYICTDFSSINCDFCGSLQIVGDAVGWGFVVRGKQPCYIQAVEPFGPAAAAGMKVDKNNYSKEILS